MRLVISDTGPINYLVLIGHIDVLPSIAGKVLLPLAVQKELKDWDAPAQVRKWISSPPSWIEVCKVPAHSFEDDAVDFLDAGEREAISLAVSLQADTLLLMDDRAGVRAARRKGLAVTGTIGLLEEAGRQGLLDFQEAFSRLRQTNFYCSQKVIEAILAKHVRTE